MILFTAPKASEPPVGTEQDPTPGKAPTIDAKAEHYALRAPAQRFRQGGRDVYHFVLDLPTLDGLLPQQVDKAIARRQPTRRFETSHAKAIQEYMTGRDDWFMNPITLAVAPEAAEFTPYPIPQPAAVEFGELRLVSRRMNTLQLLDGQHRRRAIQNALQELENDPAQAERLAALQASSVSVTLYAEDDAQALRRMFADIGKAMPGTVTETA